MSTRIDDGVDALLALTPEAALAEGLARHVEAWSKSLGAAEADARLAAAAARAVSLAVAQGHVCAMLEALGMDREALLRSRVVGTPAEPGVAPLVLDAEGRLYLHRHFDEERRLARRLLLAASPEGGGLSITSGGPGTGKTTRVASELATQLQARPGLRIALAAPTGKAAARMTEALRERAADFAPDLRERLPGESFTVHRLLGFRPGGGFAHDAANPLPIDLLVVDEASMLDLALATRLLEAVPPQARIVLLGDKDQLAAVESGAVFADLSAERGLLPVEWLEKNWRFPADSGIGLLAALVREGDAQGTAAWLRQGGGDGSLRWVEGETPAALARQGHENFLATVQAGPGQVEAAWQAFNGFRALCAVREGPQGVEAINSELARHAKQRMGVAPGATWYPGRPVMVSVNDYALRLFNGDTGITLADADGQPMVWFPQGDGSFRAVPPARMPRHETAYAMTVHKSQGSEFEQVLLVLPQADARVATRELVYTGVTRARSLVTVCADEAALSSAVERRVERQGGLRARLRELGGG